MKKLFATAALIAAAAAGPAGAQDFQAMIAQSMGQMNAIVGAAQQRVQVAVQQRMQDPVVQQAWRQHLARTGGRPGMDYPTFTYHYIYTNGFSAAGMAHMRATEGRIQQQESAAWQGVRQAEADRAGAMQQQRDRFNANQHEAGLGLRGQGSWRAPDGTTLQLPHTWQPNTLNRWNGYTVHVDHAGQYRVLGADGAWYPLRAGR
jgi:hypothetical protein